jgi:Flp pilus assembly protein TadG
MTRLAHKNDCRTGVAAVEFAVVSPILTIFVFAIVEITGAIYLQQSLTIAAYEGARVSIMSGTSSGNVTAASQRILDAKSINGAKVTVDPDPSTVEFGDPIEVTVTAPLADNSFFNRLFSTATVFSASVTMMAEK